METTFEHNENVTEQFEPARSKGMVVSFRLTADDARRLLAIAESQDKSVSQVAREAVQQYLSGPRRVRLASRITAMATDGITVTGMEDEVSTRGPDLRQSRAPATDVITAFIGSSTR
jgi:predicted transcriptional regulator